MIKCCYKCQDRVVGCHATCEKYITEKAEWEKTAEKIRQARMQENEINSSIIDSIKRKEKRKHGR